MDRRLEKLVEASKNLFSKAAIGTTISLAAFTFSPDRAESQTSKVCYDDPSYKLTVRNDGSFYKFTMNVKGQLESFWAQDDIVSASGDCYHINQGRAVRTSHRGETALATPSFVRSRRSDNARNHRKTRGRSDLGEALETANDVANIAGGVAAIVDLFSGNNNSGNNSENNSPNQERNYHPNPNRAEDSPYVDNPSESQDKKDNSSESPYENESANVRNAQGERHESPYVSDYESSSGNSLYDMEDKKEGSSGNPDESLYKISNDDWIGGNAPPLEPHERRAKEFFGGVRINTSSRTMYEVGLISRTAAYDLISWVPYVGDAKDVYVEHLSSKGKPDAADYWRGKILPDEIEESLDRLDRKTTGYRESSTVKISF